MIYIAVLRVFWWLFVLIGGAAIATRLMKFRAASRCLAYGLAGSLAGYLLAPLLGALVGLVPTVMIDPQYFTRPFVGCIAPFAAFLTCVTSFSGVLLGFVAGASIAFRRRTRA